VQNTVCICGKIYLDYGFGNSAINTRMQETASFS